MPRIAPLTDADLTDEQRELLGGVRLDGPAANIFGTLVRHPGLFRKWLPFGGKLLAGKLPARDREILILRTGWNCGTHYEFGQHVVIAKGAGLSDDDIRAVVKGTGPDGLLIAAADELHADSRIADATWAALADRYDERQLLEVPFVVGHYHMVGFVLNSLGVEREPGVPGFEDFG
ncbi:MAG TPA: carboxymuconolactone decarboxylase family protein [Acidimicrobiales bacterium]|jgi:alkylhydroperoxidase family enzyme|nr:carboxymuconolactone decarboxylase family protein [Acidimicrobiales bacterium]